MSLADAVLVETVAGVGGSTTTSEFLSSVVNLIVLLHDSIIRNAARVPLDFVSSAVLARLIRYWPKAGDTFWLIAGLESCLVPARLKG